MTQHASMRAVVMESLGDYGPLALKEVPTPIPGDGEVLARVCTSGVNRADLLQRHGKHPAPDGWPKDILGLEFSGVVEALGPDTSRWRVGDRVMGLLGGGGYAEYVTAHGSTLVPVPEGMTEHDAGAIPEVFLTAFDAAVMQMGLDAGEVLLIHAVGSGVGTSALQIGKALGAVTIGTSRTPEKLETAKALGLDHAVLGDEEWPERVLELTDGRGVDVILDLVGGPYLEGNQRVVARRGRHIVVGVPGGTSGQIDLRAMMLRRVTMKGTVLRARPLDEKVVLTRAFEERLLPFFSSGELKPVIDRVFPPEDVELAHEVMASNENFGKLLLHWE
ncbi:MAG TPA: NAD(P)H-quinone oxidoreductase [Gemmatimonadetes bacterium]|nr:NAD(P)H-quinone oxidoreductase [Gemmatimonadota bacterium]